MTRYTAFVIQNKDNDIRCEADKPHKKARMWTGRISLYHDDCFHTTLLSSKPIFKSSKAALKAMQDVVQHVRAADLSAKIVNVSTAE